MNINKHIVILSSGQPSANPRAVKEALTLHAAGYRVTFIYCPLSPWADRFDKKLFSENNGIKWISVGYHPVAQRWRYLYARLRKRIYEKTGFGHRAYALFSPELKKEALRHPADLYIGHNLGAIEAVIIAAGKFGAKAGFDAEDFHRGEYPENDPHNALTISMENRYFPRLDYCTVAAPLIGKAYSAVFPGISFITINNVFSLSYLNKEVATSQKSGLELFWFSQFIGPSRGIETVIGAINECAGYDIRLHLLGNVTDQYRNELINLVAKENSLFFMPPTAPENIFKVAAKFDIGLATEMPVSLNRKYCLSNKLFTYLLSGLCLLLSSTPAQAQFAAQHPGIGKTYEPYDGAALSALLRELYNDRTLLNRMKANSLHLASEKMNWEYESMDFLKLIKKVTGAD